ncbi:MAG: hypothetical protein, partial [Olavius algarvensis Gamma 1 endosymbiont]
CARRIAALNKQRTQTKNQLHAAQQTALTPDFLLPHKKPRKSKKNPFPELTSDQKKDNHKLAKVRVLVEHAIGGMKHFHCLTHRIRNHSTS